jgi:hypothetical protein
MSMQSTVKRRYMRIPAILAAALVQASIAGAQESAGPFERLLTVLQPGDTIVITDTTGRRTAGTLRELTASSVELQEPTKPRNEYAPLRFSGNDVRQIRFERHDSLLNGTLIGFAAGATPGLILIVGRQQGSDPINDLGLASSLVLVPAVAASGIGALMDALFFEHRIVYRSPGRQSRMSVSPWLAESGKGFQVSLRF